MRTPKIDMLKKNKEIIKPFVKIKTNINKRSCKQKFFLMNYFN